MMSKEKKQQFLDKIISKLTPENLTGVKDSMARVALTKIITSTDQQELASLLESLYNKVWRNPEKNISRLSNFGFLIACEVVEEAKVKFDISENFNKNLILAARKLSEPYWVDSSKKMIYLLGHKESSAALLYGSFDKFINNI